MTYSERALQLRPIIEMASQSIADSVALTAVELFPKWKDLVGNSGKADKGFRFRHEGKLYRTEQPEYTFVSAHIPGSSGTESLFSVVDETHAGTKEDPISYEKNMEICAGKYYIQYDVIYLCIRDSIQPLQHDLSALTGIYVDAIE